MEDDRSMDYFLTVLGMVLILEGLPYFTFPEKMKSIMEKIPHMPTYLLRIFGRGVNLLWTPHHVFNKILFF